MAVASSISSLAYANVELLHWQATAVPKKYGTNSTLTASSSNFNSELHADYTADGRVICRMFNGTNGCTLFNCKFSHDCNLKLNGKACGQNHPSYKHGS